MLHEFIMHRLLQLKVLAVAGLAEVWADACQSLSLSAGERELMQLKPHSSPGIEKPRQCS